MMNRSRLARSVFALSFAALVTADGRSTPIAAQTPAAPPRAGAPAAAAAQPREGLTGAPNRRPDEGKGPFKTLVIRGVTVCGPPTLIPRDVTSLGCEIAYDLSKLREADVIYALRMQHERMGDSFLPTMREYVANYQIDSRRLHPRQLLMHPGPVNRGVELSAEVIESPQALITEQVAAGLVVRMAILYELLSGGRQDAAGPAPMPPVEQPA